MNDVVRIRPLELADTELICKWHNADYVRKFLFGQEPITPEAHELYYQKNILTQKVYQFVIEILDAHTAIGSVFLKNIDSKNRNCEVGIFIGEKTLQGKGYGSSAIRLIVNYAFYSLRLHKVYALILENNRASVKAFERAGFKEEGNMRDAYCRDAAYYNVVIMSMVNDGEIK